MNKPRSDSKLEPYRDLLYPRMQENIGYTELRAWLKKEHGVSTSNAALSMAWQRWAKDEFEHEVLSSKGLAAKVVEEIKAGDVETMSAATKAKLTEAAFDMAMKGGNEKIVVKYCTLLHKARQLDLEVQKAMDKLKAQQDQALDRLFEDIQGNPDAEKYFNMMRDALHAANEEAAHG
jgi:hypothetical protein